MYYSLRMHVCQSTKQFLHISSSHLFSEDLVLLLGNLIEQLSTIDVLHHEIDVFFINICFVILHDIRMIQLGQYRNFFLDCIKMILQLFLVHNLNGNLMLRVMLVESQEYLTESTRSQDLGVVVDVVVLLQLLGTLLLMCLKSIPLHSMVLCRGFV